MASWEMTEPVLGAQLELELAGPAWERAHEGSEKNGWGSLVHWNHV